MDALKVNTDIINAAAGQIKGYNKQIRDDFDSLQSAVSRLDSTWDGSAATNTIKKFNEIKSSYCDARYAVMDNFVGFLYQQVGIGYENVETTNKSLADQFK